MRMEVQMNLGLLRELTPDDVIDISNLLPLAESSNDQSSKKHLY
jgi:hypothetical protein